MRRNVYVLVDNTKNEMISAVIARNEKDLSIQLDAAMQKENIDIDVSAYWVDYIELDDDNDFFVYDEVRPSVWSSVKTVVSKTVKSDVFDSQEGEND